MTRDNEFRALYYLSCCVYVIRRRFGILEHVVAPFSANWYCTWKIYWKRREFSRIHTRTNL